MTASFAATLLRTYYSLLALLAQALHRTRQSSAGSSSTGGSGSHHSGAHVLRPPGSEELRLSVPDLLQTVKNYVGTDKHEQLDELLRRYTSKQLGKQQLQFELRVVAGRDALRQALLAMVPQIDELQKKREAMKLQQVRRHSSRS